MSPNPKEAQTQNFFAFFSREFVNETLNPRTKPLFLSRQKDRLFVKVCSVCVCVHINIKE